MLSVNLSCPNSTKLPTKILKRTKKYRNLNAGSRGKELFIRELFCNYCHQPKRNLQPFQDICDNQVLPRVTIRISDKSEFFSV